VEVTGGGGVTIATKDWGGGGIPLLLTHGAFFFKETLDGLVPHLLDTFRVVTFDMRNHGASGEGPWEWPLVTADVEAVRVAYGIDSPVVAGHSLGGMVAALYAADYPGCRAVINIDGQGRGKPSNYLDMTEAEVHEAWAAMDEAQRPMLEMLNKPRLVAMLDDINALDMFAVWRSVPCPFLMFNCVADDPQYDAMGPNGARMFRAYRSGLQRDFAALALERPSFHVADVDKTHLTVVMEPADTAEKMATFVTNYAAERG
jgi:pimeloyl-ACP methyl ester carboxylesterase